MWQPQPQKNRPNRNVESRAAAKNTKPALSCPSSIVYIDSDGSTGESVGRGLPPLDPSTTGRAISTFTLTSTTARQRDTLDLRMRCLSPLGPGMTLSATVLGFPAGVPTP